MTLTLAEAAREVLRKESIFRASSEAMANLQEALVAEEARPKVERRELRDGDSLNGERISISAGLTWNGWRFYAERPIPPPPPTPIVIKHNGVNYLTGIQISLEKRLETIAETEARFSVNEQEVLREAAAELRRLNALLKEERSDERD